MTNSNTKNTLAEFGAPCTFGGGKVLCCKKVNSPSDVLGGVVEGAHEAAGCPEGQMRYQGKCQVPPVLPGTKGGGFIQLIPTCAAGKTYSETAKDCVATPDKVKTCTVLKASVVYDKPGGNGQQTGDELAVGTGGVMLREQDGSNWFQVKWPAGEGWVYSGPGYPDAIRCP